MADRNALLFCSGMNMTEEQIKETALRILKEVAPEADIESLHLEKRIRDQLDFDSVDFLNYSIALQEELKIKIPESDLHKLATLSGCVEYVRSRMASQSFKVHPG